MQIKDIMWKLPEDERKILTDVAPEDDPDRYTEIDDPEEIDTDE